MKINSKVTITSGGETIAGTIDGFEADDGGYVLHVFIQTEGGD